jgi:hypothetical protein
MAFKILANVNKATLAASRVWVWGLTMAMTAAFKVE